MTIVKLIVVGGVVVNKTQMLKDAKHQNIKLKKKTMK